MKQLHFRLLIALLTGSLGTAHAQTEKGTWALGLNTATGIWPNNPYTVQSSTTRSSFRLTPSAGFFPKKNVFIGLGVPVEFGTTQYRFLGQSGEPPQFTTSSVGLSLIARRYLGTGRFKPFVHLEGSYSWNAITSTRDLQVEGLVGRTPATIRANAGVGVSYFVGNRLSVDATATLGVDDVQDAFRSSKLAPFNRFLLLGVGVNWYLAPRA